MSGLTFLLGNERSAWDQAARLLNELSAFDTGQNSIVAANSEECKKKPQWWYFFHVGLLDK